MISQKTRSSLTITIGTILVVVGTLVLVAFASGYNLDILSGEIYTTGLALLNTNPSGADISINGQKLSQKTPHRLENLKTGPLSVGYSRANYHSWKTDYFIRAGEVTFADYALLIPLSIEPKQIEPQNNYGNLFNSKDNTKVFTILSSPPELFEIREDSTLRRVVELPVDSSLKAPLGASLLAINNEGSVVVLQINYESTNTTFWINTASGEFVNVSSITQLPFSSMQINPRNNREIFALNGGQIHRINIVDRTSTSLPLSAITTFNVDSDSLYTMESLNPAENGQFFVRYDLSGNNRYVLSQFPASPQPWLIQLSRLNGQSNASLTDPTTNTLHVVRQLDGKILTSNLGTNISAVKFSLNGRFISYLQTGDMRTIDLEFAERYRAPIEAAESISWLTNFQTIITKKDGLHIADFTGQNIIKIPPNTTANDKLNLTIDKDGKRIYFLLNAKLHTYDLEPSEGLINFR